jgi:lipopolysaccharide export system permease protein
MPVVVSILLFISYYIFSMTGEKSAREDVWQMFAGMWFSSYIFLPVGFWLTYKAVTDSPIMTAEAYLNVIQRLKISRFFKKYLKDENTTTDQQTTLS